MYHYSMEVSDYYSATKDHFAVEDLFNFNEEETINNSEDNNTAFEGINVNSSSSSIAATDVSSGNSISAYNQHFSTDFSEPVEEVAELEWLSNFMEDCFSNKDSHHHHHHYHQHHYQAQDPAHYSSTSNAVPAKARSKRSRANPGNWAARIPILPTQEEDIQEHVQNVIAATCQEGSGRRCLHCGSDKTPQWRMGPMGPKTLCNACGVRYKSGRLVPEYRPAASPTFVVSEHSNSHRKVVELRRQKEMQKQQKQHQNMLFWS